MSGLTSDNSCSIRKHSSTLSERPPNLVCACIISADVTRINVLHYLRSMKLLRLVFNACYINSCIFVLLNIRIVHLVQFRVAIWDGKRAEPVITSVTLLLSNQHIASESEMCVNMHVISAVDKPRAGQSEFFSSVSTIGSIAAFRLFFKMVDNMRPRPT